MSSLLILVAIAILAVPITAFLCAIGDNFAEKWRKK
jgi:nitrogen fixation-related uncharacterized protein